MSVNRLAHKLPKELKAAVDASLDDWKKNNKVARLWQKDASLWSNTDAADARLARRTLKDRYSWLEEGIFDPAPEGALARHAEASQAVGEGQEGRPDRRADGHLTREG